MLAGPCAEESESEIPGKKAKTSGKKNKQNKRERFNILLRDF